MAKQMERNEKICHYLQEWILFSPSKLILISWVKKKADCIPREPNSRHTRKGPLRPMGLSNFGNCNSINSFFIIMVYEKFIFSIITEK